jgi:hypothetical protein
MLVAAMSLSLNMMCDSVTDAASLATGFNAGAPNATHDRAEPHAHGHSHGTDGVTHLHGHQDGTVHLATAADAGKSVPDDKGIDCDCLGCWTACHFCGVILSASPVVMPLLTSGRYAVDGPGPILGADPNGPVRPPRTPTIA